MNKIIKKIQYSEKVFRFDVEAPLIAKSRKAGNFVIIRVDNNSERMPLTIADADMPAVKNMIWMLFSLFPAIIAGLMMLLVKLYPIKK